MLRFLILFTAGLFALPVVNERPRPRHRLTMVSEVFRMSPDTGLRKGKTVTEVEVEILSQDQESTDVRWRFLKVEPAGQGDDLTMEMARILGPMLVGMTYEAKLHHSGQEVTLLNTAQVEKKYAEIFQKAEEIMEKKGDAELWKRIAADARLKSPESVQRQATQMFQEYYDVLLFPYPAEVKDQKVEATMPNMITGEQLPAEMVVNAHKVNESEFQMSRTISLTAESRAKLHAFIVDFVGKKSPEMGEKLKKIPAPHLVDALKSTARNDCGLWIPEARYIRTVSVAGGMEIRSVTFTAEKPDICSQN